MVSLLVIGHICLLISATLRPTISYTDNSPDLKNLLSLADILGVGIEKYQQHLGPRGGAAVGHPNRVTSDASAQASFPSEGELPLQFLEDVSLEVQVALGRVTLSIQKILGLKEGSIIQLEREPDSTCDVLINGNHVARGEVVIVNDHYGIRVTSVKEPHFFTELDGEGS